MTKRYTLNEVKKFFCIYRQTRNSDITDDEFVFFCDTLHILPKEVIDGLDRDAYFVLLSARQPHAVNAACIIPLEDEDLKGKKAMIILTPIIFGFGIDWIKHGDDQRWNILHEIAHFHLKTNAYQNPEDKERKEKEADGLVQKWLDDWMNERCKD